MEASQPADGPSSSAAAAPGPRRGLSLEQVEQQRSQYGPNLLQSPRAVPLWRRLTAHLLHFFSVMLWMAGGLAILAGMPQLRVAIFVVIVLNGAFAFVQEYRAEKAGERLRDLVPRRVIVIRRGIRESIDAIDLVPWRRRCHRARRSHFGRYASRGRQWARRGYGRADR